MVHFSVTIDAIGWIIIHNQVSSEMKLMDKHSVMRVLLRNLMYSMVIIITIN